MQSTSGVPVVFWPVHRAELLLSKIPTKFTNAAKAPGESGMSCQAGVTSLDPGFLTPE